MNGPLRLLALALLIMAAGCAEDDGADRRGSDESTMPPATVGQADSTKLAASTEECAHVVAVDVSGAASGYTFSVTVSSTETGWDKYADAWVVKDVDGTVYGERVLAHPHVEEQPFTRSLSGVAVPDDVAEVVVAARDSLLGFCGDEMTVQLGGRG
ncbi:MAG: hypothetical protein QNJ88_02455 [Acidimicrobiia bacterium]|nr:hypothetical protein [Acidimicrobiia bacterium]